MKREKADRQRRVASAIVVAGALSLGAALVSAQQTNPSKQRASQGSQSSQSQRASISQNLIAAENFRDQRVVDAQNRDVGTITELYIDPQSGRVQRADIEFSTSMFGPDHKYSVEWNKLKVKQQGNNNKDMVVMLDESIVRRVQQAKGGGLTEGDGIYNQDRTDGRAQTASRDRNGGGLGIGERDRNQRQISASQLNAEQIRKIQQKLNQEGFHAGQVDGNWSSQTQTAIRDFQQTKGINATGQLDERTLNEMGLDADEFRGAKQSQSGSRSGGAQR